MCRFRYPDHPNALIIDSTFASMETMISIILSRVDNEQEDRVICLGTCASSYGGAQNRVGNANPGQARQVKLLTTVNGVRPQKHGTALQPKLYQNFELLHRQ
ncbi:hypothetical protein Tco_0381615 [Tanacetum coccineum]